MFRRDDIPGIQPIYVCGLCAHVIQRSPGEEDASLGLRMLTHVCAELAVAS